MRRLGIIGGVSWHSSLEYYRLLNQGIGQRLGGHHGAQLLLSSLDFADLLAWQKNSDESVLKQEFLAEGKRLKAAGCDGFIVASHTLSWLGEDIQEQLGFQHVSLYSALFNSLSRLGARSVGLTGTRYTMGDPLYRKKYEEAGFKVVIPDEPHFTAVASVIYKELVRGIFKEQSREPFFRCFDHLVEKGADAIVLGCTEIGLLVRERTWPFRSSAREGQVVLVDLIESHAAECIDWMLQD